MFFGFGSKKIPTVDVFTLQKWLDNGEACLIDVREVDENKAARIEGAKLVPLSQVCIEKITNAKCGNPNCDCQDCGHQNCKCRDKKLVIHCRSGKRSEMACERLLEENPDLEIYNLEGGIMAWASAGNKILKD